MKPELNDIYNKYKQRIEAELGAAVEDKQPYSKEYKEFREEIKGVRLSIYEKFCEFSEKFIQIKPDKQKAALMQESIDIAHLNVTPTGATSFAILIPLSIMFFGSLISFALLQSFFFVVFFLVIGVSLISPFGQLPVYIANGWRMKASNQMVLCIFYVVTFMRHTSNLEGAMEFASDHLAAPLSLDLKKVLWDVETEKYENVRESLDIYLESWKKYNFEFIEAFHLIESSLFEGSEEKRLATLDRGLEVMLSETYEKMLHYAHSLKSPIIMLHMLGIILPILGLVILPLVVSFLSSDGNPLVTAVYISLLYNISLPLSVYYLGQTILSKRPAGYGAADIGERPQFKKYRNVNIPLGGKVSISVNPLYFSVVIFAVLAIIGLSPLILHALNPEFEISFAEGNYKFMEYLCPPKIEGGCAPAEMIGPYGLGASIISLVLVLALGLSIGAYFALRSKNVIQIRERTKALEDEFSSALFQLGNRLGDGLPAEIAFAKVAQVMRGTTSGEFFNITEKNITTLGMGLEQAIFDQRVGSLYSFPSKVIESSMKVLIESIKKGPRIAAQALLSMSQYIKEIHRVEERLKDLMADVISSMKSQIKFLTPAIAGIVIGITSMISTILTRLSAQLIELTSQGQDTGSFGGLLEIIE